MTIAYDGSRYQGWQRQPSTDLTIQGTLEKTISGILGYDVEVQGSGRTDGGVHAKGQTASIVLRGKIEEARFLSECAKRLPEDICIRKIELVKNGFHARHSARGKCYVYTVDTREKRMYFPENIRDTIRGNWMFRRWEKLRAFWSGRMILRDLPIGKMKSPQFGEFMI